jgi:hypothetical protein
MPTTKPLPRPDRFAESTEGNPYWNESVWFSFNKPDEKINGIIQYYFRPNMGLLNGGPIIYQPDRHSIYDCLFFDWAHLQAAPAGVDKFNMTAPNSLSCRVVEPLKTYAIGYDREGLNMDLTWTAIGPLHEMAATHEVQQKNARYHFEQPGRMTGTITLDDRTIAIDCLSMRDGSSGPRTYDRIQSGSYFWGVEEDRCFHAIAMGDGNCRALIGGFVWKDGEMASIVSGARSVIEHGTYGPRRVRVEAMDKLGRTSIFEGEVEQGLIHTGYTTHTVVWSLTEWTWDGMKLWGEHQEFCSARSFRKIARAAANAGR